MRTTFSLAGHMRAWREGLAAQLACPSALQQRRVLRLQAPVNMADGRETELSHECICPVTEDCIFILLVCLGQTEHSVKTELAKGESVPGGRVPSSCSSKNWVFPSHSRLPWCGPGSITFPLNSKEFVLKGKRSGLEMACMMGGAGALLGCSFWLRITQSIY